MGTRCSARSLPWTTSRSRSSSPDDIIDSKVPATKQLMDVYDKYRSPVVAICEVPEEAVSSYGIIGAVEVEPGVYQVREMVEKPSVEEVAFQPCHNRPVCPYSGHIRVFKRDQARARAERYNSPTGFGN